MNRTEFNEALGKALIGLPPADRQRSLEYYNEMIDDRMEEGMPESEAVAALGPMDQIVQKSLADVPIGRLVRQKVRPKRSLRGWEIALLIIGAPLWLPLLIAAGAVLLALYVSAWAVVISLFAVAVGCWAGALGALAAAVSWVIHGGVWQALAMLGGALLLAGLGILVFRLAVSAAVGLAKLIARGLLAIKSKLIRKEAEQA